MGERRGMVKEEGRRVKIRRKLGRRALEYEKKLKKGGESGWARSY